MQLGMDEGSNDEFGKLLVGMVSGYAERLINYETLQEVKVSNRNRLCLLALNAVEKSFFMNADPKMITASISKELNVWKSELVKEEEQFKFFLRKLFPDVNVIVNLSRFNTLLIKFIDSVVDRNHAAFENCRLFLDSPSPFDNVKDLKLNERTFEAYLLGDFRKAQREYKKIKIILSPEKLINGFLSQDKVIIDKVENFVYSCFEFNGQYATPSDLTDGFVFHSRFKHAVTDLLFEMKRKKWVTSTNEEIIDLIVQLIPNSSRESLKKYSSPQKKISPKHRIDIHLFS
jgi:hypothetical protein